MTENIAKNVLTRLVFNMLSRDITQTILAGQINKNRNNPATSPFDKSIPENIGNISAIDAETLPAITIDTANIIIPLKARGKETPVFLCGGCPADINRLLS